jgi:hypothetical protein
MFSTLIYPLVKFAQYPQAVLTWLNALARVDLDPQDPVVQMLDVELSSSQSRQQVDLGLDDQVVPVPLEPRVFLLLDNKDNITRLDTRSLITLAGELDLVSALHTLVDVNLEDLALLRRLLGVTRPTLVLGVHNLSGSVTFTTGLLDLLDHRSELTQVNLDTLSLTPATLLDGTLLSTESVAGLADGRFGEGELLDLSLVKIFEADPDPVNQVLAPSRSLWSSYQAFRQSIHTISTNIQA